MKQTIPFPLLLLLLTGSTFAQNLLLNPGFETYSDCPLDHAFLTADGCYQIEGTADYYNTCFDNPDASFPVGVPENFIGYQQPHSGEGYIGFGAYINFGLGDENTREVAALELTTALEIGSTYYVSMMVSMGNNSATAINKLGAKFIGESTLNGNNVLNELINNTAHVFTNEIISDSSSWVMIKGEFVADSSYQYMVLGNFFDDNLLDTMFIQNVNISGTTDFGYYLFDDICVSRDSADCFPVILSNDDTADNTPIALYPNPANDKIYFEHVEAVAKIKLVDVVGRLVLEKQVCTEMDISNLASGAYFVQFENRQGQMLDVQKLIKH